LISPCRPNLQGLYFTQSGVFSLDADRVICTKGRRKHTESLSIQITLGPGKSIGTYAAADNSTFSVALAISPANGSEEIYLLPENRRKFALRLARIDTLQGGLAGEFSGVLFKRINEASLETSITDSVIISDGRFDILLKK
jgi:hypothetical protein